MPRTHHRPRRQVSVRTARLLPLLGFRYSTVRDAYVLRLIGSQVGPVLQVGTALPPLRTSPSRSQNETAEVR
jgi:hypothetical protein